MEKDYYELQWPRDNLYFACYVNESLNYRYHWHPSEYELQIVLSGRQEFCREKERFVMEEDDVILTDPNAGHASFSTTVNTRTLVVRFSALAFKPFLKKGSRFSFPDCLSSAATRSRLPYRRIRLYAAQLLDAASGDSPYGQMTARGSAELLLATFLQDCSPQVTATLPDQNEAQQELMQRLAQYIEEHYREKITLEELARFSQYNRTYISTLFKNMVGINFYDYLMRVRMKYALLDLADNKKNLTVVALDNGFSDLKSFSSRFRDIFQYTPSQYRRSVSQDCVLHDLGRRLVPAADPLVRQKLDSYMGLSCLSGNGTHAAP